MKVFGDPRARAKARRYIVWCAEDVLFCTGLFGGIARACLYILDTGHRRGCPPGYGCKKHTTPEAFAKTPHGSEIMRMRMRSAGGGAKNRGRRKRR